MAGPHKKWYIAHELLSFQPKSRKQKQKIVVWENLILIAANNAEKAYRKALRNGRLNEQHVTINGVEGLCKFVGLKDLVFIHDELTDGAELEWHEFLAVASKIKKMPKRKTQMHAFKKR